MLARAAIGVQTQVFNDLGAIIQQWGIYGREGWNLLGNDPRETGEEIRGPQDPGGRAGGIWGGQYRAIRTINTYLAALANASALTAAEERGGTGIRRDDQGLAHFTFLQFGADRREFRSTWISRSPIRRRHWCRWTPRWPHASALFDQGYADLQAGGAASRSRFVPGYTGFTTPATFAQVNRALAAKLLVHRATFVNCAACWAQASTAIGQSFITTTGLPGSLELACTSASRAHRMSRTIQYRRTHVQLDIGCIPRSSPARNFEPNGHPDLRLTTKVALAPAPRTLNNLTGTYKPVMYNDPGTLAPDLGAFIPWITNEELLLLRAEIRWNTGTRRGADDINLVRVNAGGLAPTTLTAASSDAAFVDELLYNRLYSLMWTQGTRWIDARRYGRQAHCRWTEQATWYIRNMLIPSAECDARRLTVPCSIGS